MAHHAAWFWVESIDLVTLRREGVDNLVIAIFSGRPRTDQQAGAPNSHAVLGRGVAEPFQRRGDKMMNGAQWCSNRISLPLTLSVEARPGDRVVCYMGPGTF